jgi:hypothetical protein
MGPLVCSQMLLEVVFVQGFNSLRFHDILGLISEVQELVRFRLERLHTRPWLLNMKEIRSLVLWIILLFIETVDPF